VNRLQTRPDGPDPGLKPPLPGRSGHAFLSLGPSMGFPKTFYRRETAQVARDLLGAWLVHGEVGGVVVETEAYLGSEDPASHAFRGPTPRSSVMFGDPGHAYVYFIYGNHYCFNVVAHPPGRAGAVLIRALEPRLGLDLMRTRRGSCTMRDLTRGPGRLCQALGIDRTLNGADLSGGFLRCGPLPGGQSAPLGRPCRSARVGLTRARHEPLRFFLEGNPHVSRGPCAVSEIP
jgi:DNA-3-methyladenine glycosylase